MQLLNSLTLASHGKPVATRQLSRSLISRPFSERPSFLGKSSAKGVKADDPALSTPSAQRKKALLTEIYERRGKKTYDKLATMDENYQRQGGVHSTKMRRIHNKDLWETKTIMELNSSRLSPNLAEYAQSLEALNSHKTPPKEERTLFHETQLPLLLKGEQDNDKKGFNFVRNNDFFSKMLDLDPGRHRVIDNDWQQESTIAKLSNHLDILPRCPGIYPTEAITQFNPKKLTPFFTRLPQYSQINEQCIAPYFPPGSDVNLKRLAARH